MGTRVRGRREAAWKGGTGAAAARVSGDDGKQRGWVDWGGGEAHLVEEPIPSSRAWFDGRSDMVQLYTPLVRYNYIIS